MTDPKIWYSGVVLSTAALVAGVCLQSYALGVAARLCPTYHEGNRLIASAYDGTWCKYERVVDLNKSPAELRRQAGAIERMERIKLSKIK